MTPWLPVASAVLAFAAGGYVGWEWRDGEAAKAEAERLRDERVQRDALQKGMDLAARETERMLAAGRTPTEALAFLSTTLTNRLLHGPSTALRDAAQSGDSELLRTAMRLLHLDRTPDE